MNGSNNTNANASYVPLGTSGLSGPGLPSGNGSASHRLEDEVKDLKTRRRDHRNDVTQNYVQWVGREMGNMSAIELADLEKTLRHLAADVRGSIISAARDRR